MKIRHMLACAAMLLIGCKESAPSISQVGNAYELKVASIWDRELKRPLPEILIFDKAGSCVYHSFGFDKVNFSNDLQEIFFPEEKPEFDVDQFVKDHPELAEKIAQQVRNAVGDADNATIEDAIYSSYEQVAESLATQTGATNSCNASLSQQLAVMSTLDGRSLAPYQLIKANHFTIVEYWANWCLPCKQQRKVLDEFISTRKPNVVFLHVERDANQK